MVLRGGYVRTAGCAMHNDVTEDIAARIRAFLDAHHVMSLATLGPDGVHAANLFYACDGFSLLWLSDPQSRHSRELEAESSVSATVALPVRSIEPVPPYVTFVPTFCVRFWPASGETTA